jgi:tyrosyl-tRNA synthetase
MTMPILEGLDGVQKMSKSLDNYIGIDEAPSEMFGKLMSVSDELMWRYFELLSFKSIQEIESLKDQVKKGVNPRDIKMDLATEIITRFHDNQKAEEAKEDFITRFQKGDLPKDIPEREISTDGASSVAIWSVLKDATLTSSTSEARRMIKQGAVKIDGERIEDLDHELHVGTSVVIQVGKRKFARITLV